jgi:phosphoribosyl-ATP pyrophosphohydrolase
MPIFRKLNKVFFSKPTAREIAVADLEDNQRALIKEIAAMHYHQKMVDYYYAIISELQERVK